MRWTYSFDGMNELPGSSGVQAQWRCSPCARHQCRA